MENNKMRGKVKVIDIETDNLLEAMVDHTSFPYKLKSSAKLHVVVIRDVYTNEVFKAEQENITKEWLKEALKGCEILVQHNGVKFDLIALKLFGVLDYTIGYLNEPDTLFGAPIKIIDTLILSRLFNPDRYGGHSLESWGERTGSAKMDFRGELIAQGIIPKDSPKGFEFKEFTPLMTTYCEIDTEVNKNTFLQLVEEKKEYSGWAQAIKMEHKLADLAVRRETLGFWFDKDLAIKCLDDLGEKMEELRNKVNPILPPKPMTKGELKEFTPPATQLNKKGEPSHYIIKFAERIGGVVEQKNDSNLYVLNFNGVRHALPFDYPLKTTTQPDISNLDHVKSTLIDVYKWIPIEWSERDFTKDAKKQTLPYEKRVIAFERWLKETVEGKYKKLRLKTAFENFKVKSVEALEEAVKEKLNQDFPVRLPTSPKVRVGTEKELCPNLTKLGESVSFASDFALYLTYKHRRSSIAGGEIEDMDFDNEYPNTGFLSMYREEDGRIPTFAIEIGAACVTRDTELVTFSGLKKIVDVQLGDEVLTHEGTYGKVTDLINNGIKPVFKITTDSGLKLTCTDNHPFMTVEEGWVRLKDLNKEKHTLLVYGEEERWGNHPIFTNYSVSSWGRVLSKDGKEMKGLAYKENLSVVLDLYDGFGKKSRRSLGKIVCETFNGLCPEGLEVRHLDGNVFNNNLKNLKFGTSKENSEDSAKHRYFMKKRRATVEKITDKQVLDILEHFKSNTYNKGDDDLFAKKYNVSREYIRDIRKGKRRVIVTPYKEEFAKTKIISIQYIGEEPTYDITVGNQHSYIANGIVTHNTNRYRHIGVANIARASSIYGKEMRSLFGCGKGFLQTGFDFSSLENRVQGGYVKKYPHGEELAEMLLAEKPRDLHSVNAKKLGISRTDAKSFTYAVLYGASPKKISNMLNVPIEKGKELFDSFWEAVPALKMLRDNLIKHWEKNDKKWIKGIDGRKIMVRSPHSLINYLFQSSGVVCAKYTLVYLMEVLEKQNYNIDCFKGTPDIAELISYHDETQLLTKPELIKFKLFSTEEEAEEFKKNWKGEGKLSGIKEGNKNNWYVALPNPLSLAIERATEMTEKLLNLQFELAFEFDVHKNWYGCH